jgi:hypothetical protein
MSYSTPSPFLSLPSSLSSAAFFALNVAIALVPLHHVRVTQGTTKDVQGAANRQVHLFSKNDLFIILFSFLFYSMNAAKSMHCVCM